MMTTNPSETVVQPSYSRCFVCGAGNPFGLKVVFRNEGDKVRTEFLPEERHMGYPGVLHGGILYALLDETIGRAAFLRDQWVMTGRMEVRYFKPVPIGRSLIITGEIVKERKAAMEMKGEARFEDGTLVAQGSGLFMKIDAAMQAEVEKVMTYHL